MQQEVIGLVPMAGRATRLGPLPCSKELYPVAIQNGIRGNYPKVISHFLLERMRLAGIKQAFLIIRDGKWDIPAYFRDGAELLDLSLAYLIAQLPYGPPFSLDSAYPFVRDSIVAMGFPDIIFRPDDAYCRILARQAETQADMVLGLFHLPQPMVDDMVETDGRGRVTRYFMKQRMPNLTHTWNVAVWTPKFTEFMHDYLRHYLKSNDAPSSEYIFGHVIHAAVNAGLVVQSEFLLNAAYLDIGTPDRLAKIQDFFIQPDSESARYHANC